MISFFMLGLVLLLLIQQLWSLRDPVRFPPDDFVEYYAAGKLNRQGQNPYNPDLLLPIENEAGRKTEVAIMMWNPPWTLTLAMPLSLFNSEDAKVLWLIMSFVLVAYCADQLWKVYDGPKHLRWLAWVFMLTFFPTWIVFAAGQISAWLLLGITLFLKFSKSNRWFLAGASTVFMAIKPHLFFLFWIVIFIWGCRNKYKLLLGGIVAGLITAFIPTLFNPEVWSHYHQELTQRPPAQWKSPTLGTVIRLIQMKLTDNSVSGTFSSQFIPLFLGLFWLIVYYWQFIPYLNNTKMTKPVDDSADPGSGDTDHSHSNGRFCWLIDLPKVILISFVTAAYGAWPYDMVVLYIGVVHLLTSSVKLSIQLGENRRKNTIIQLLMGLWIVLNSMAFLMNLVEVEAFGFIWYPPSFAIIYFYGIKKLSMDLKRDHSLQGIT